MPIYEFECEFTGDIKEVILPLSEADNDRMFCPIHCRPYVEEYKEKFVTNMGRRFPLHSAVKIWSLPARTDLGAPTRVFINNRTGEIFTPISKSDQAPIGYHEEQLKDSIQRSKFEKEYQRKLDATNEIVTHELESQKAAITKRRHDDINSRMNAVQRETDPVTGKEVEYTLDHRDKEVLKKAMNRTKKKKFRPRTSDFKFAVNHNNRNNLDEVK